MRGVSSARCKWKHRRRLNSDWTISRLWLSAVTWLSCCCCARWRCVLVAHVRTPSYHHIEVLLRPDSDARKSRFQVSYDHLTQFHVFLTTFWELRIDLTIMVTRCPRFSGNAIETMSNTIQIADHVQINLFPDGHAFSETIWQISRNLLNLFQNMEFFYFNCFVWSVEL